MKRWDVKRWDVKHWDVKRWNVKHLDVERGDVEFKSGVTCLSFSIPLGRLQLRLLAAMLPPVGTCANTRARPL